MAMHPGQLVVTPATVRRLVTAQFPAWSTLPVREVAGPGTVHAIFRLGEELAARFPLQPGEPAEVRRRLIAEQEAAAELHATTRVPTPRPVALGEPGADYPLPWSVQTWLAGPTADDTGVADSVAFARDLAALIGELRSAPTRGRRFAGDNRGGDLRRHDGWVATCPEQRRPARRAGAAPAVGAAAHPPAPRARRHDPRRSRPGQRARSRRPARGPPGHGRLRARLGARAGARAVWYYDVSNPAMRELGRRTIARLLAAT